MGAINGVGGSSKGKKNKTKATKATKQKKGNAKAPLKGSKGHSHARGTRGPGHGKEKSNVLFTILLSIVIMLATSATLTCVYMFYLEPKVYNEAVASVEISKARAFVATRDIQSGELIGDAITMTEIPSELSVSNALSSSADTGKLRASTPIMKNSIITVNNTYEPEKQDVTLNGSRLIAIDYLDTGNVSAGDYVDIRIKRYTDESASTYSDDVVCSKKLILDKKTNGDIIMSLSESDILNLNTAVVETAVKKSGGAKATVELYLATYVDPANQTKAQVTYSGKGVTYSSAELAEAERLIRYMNSGEGTVYSAPEANVTIVE